MQYCDGGNLHDYISRLDGENSKQSSYLSFVYSCNIFEGLTYLNKNGLYHNDIKPENIFIHDTKALIGDFGLLSYKDGLKKKQIFFMRKYRFIFFLKIQKLFFEI